MEKLQLQNKSVLITGADSGIGKAIALLFAKEQILPSSTIMMPKMP